MCYLLRCFCLKPRKFLLTLFINSCFIQKRDFVLYVIIQIYCFIFKHVV